MAGTGTPQVADRRGTATGCAIQYVLRGFHYGMLNQLGKLIYELSVSFQPCMNWVDKNWEEYQVYQVRKIVASGLFKDIRKAEKSAIKWKEENP